MQQMEFKKVITGLEIISEEWELKGGNKYAVLATAGKLATIYYNMVRNKEEFKPMDLIKYQEKYKQAKISYLERTLKRLKEVAAWGVV